MQAAELYQWRGTALGARATITLSHPDARRICERARAEIDRLKDIFSLYRPGSALSRLNAAGRLGDPPFEFLECLGQCSAAHHVTGGVFDPTIQPVWKLHADRAVSGERPTVAQLRAAVDRTGWRYVTVDSGEISFARTGMALTLNGIAQGYIADRVAALFSAEGLDDVLIDTGEMVALGGRPNAGAWDVTLATPTARLAQTQPLRDMALASSSPLGTLIGPNGAGHILDPRTGTPAMSKWTLVSVTAPHAAYADALSTAGCLMDRDAFSHAVGQVPGAMIARLV